MCKLISHKRRQISGYLGLGGGGSQRERSQKGHQEILQEGGRCEVHCVDCSDGFTGMCASRSKFIKLCTLK